MAWGHQVRPRATASVWKGERRRTPRKVVLSLGVIADANGENLVDCSILDISASGAMVTLSKVFEGDAELYLIDPINGLVHSATVIWKDGDRTGLSFIGSYSPKLNLPRRLTFLRKLLIDAKLRHPPPYMGD